MGLEIYEINPARFLIAPGLAMADILKKNKVKIRLLTNINMLFMVEKCIRRGGIYHAFVEYVIISYPAGKYWSPRRPEDVPVQGPHVVL